LLIAVRQEPVRVSETDPKPPPNEPKQPAPRNPTEARQGIRAGRVVWVLVGGIVLVVIAYLAIGAFTSVPHPPPSIGIESGPVGPSPNGGQPASGHSTPSQPPAGQPAAGQPGK
jgi:hypothetical protein